MTFGDWRAIVSRCCSLITCLALAGCGSQPKLPGPRPQPVHGSVLYQGKPAAGFRVSFNPLTVWEGAKFAPSALTNENGEFQLRSYDDNDGAPAGDYVVTFAWPQSIVRDGDPDDAPVRIDRLKGRFADPQKSQIKIIVHEGENALEPFTLK